MDKDINDYRPALLRKNNLWIGRNGLVLLKTELRIHFCNIDGMSFSIRQLKLLMFQHETLEAPRSYASTLDT